MPNDRPPAPSRLALHALVAALVLALLVAAAAWWLQRDTAPPDAPRAEAAPAAEPQGSAPAVAHPLPPQADAMAPPESLNDALVALLGRNVVLKHLQLDDFARRIVATVDNLDRAHAAPALWPVNPTPGRFTVERHGGGERIALDNGLRYAAFVQWIERADTAATVELYYRLYPQLQRAYEELGYPGRYFNDRVVAVIDQLLAAPEPAEAPAVRLTEVKGPVPAQRPWVRYEFVDPELEALAPGPKIMVRMGTSNARRVKTKLAELRRHLTGRPEAR